MTGELDRILTIREPFGPRDTESVINLGLTSADLLFDRSNLIYSQATGPSRPTYIIGRKGAGKTAFLRGSMVSGPQRVELRTATVYHEMMSVLRRYDQSRGRLFVEQAAEIWLALFEHVAAFHACRTASPDDPPNELQVLWDYLGEPVDGPGDATPVTERFLATLQRRIMDDSVVGLSEVVEGLSWGGVSFGAARQALSVVLGRRPQPLIIVMDNLEDLHARMFELQEVLASLFRCVGRVIAENQDNRPFGLQICLPSELFDQIHDISANPEKDFRGSYLTIYWTAKELLKLAGTRLRLYLLAHHPDQLDGLARRADQIDESEFGVALLRAALPPRIHNGLGAEEDPVAYLLRHTQLLPRHLIEILNSVFTVQLPESSPWAVTENAVLAGTRAAERMIVNGIFAAHSASFPLARDALNRLCDRLEICFPAKELRKVFTRQGIRKLTGLDFDQFLAMLFTLGVVGVRIDQTLRYDKAHFQYTFDATLNIDEDLDHLCFHPLFTRYLHERSLPRLRKKRARATYPYGCDPADDDYRFKLGYTHRLKRN